MLTEIDIVRIAGQVAAALTCDNAGRDGISHGTGSAGWFEVTVTKTPYPYRS